MWVGPGWQSGGDLVGGWRERRPYFSKTGLLGLDTPFSSKVSIANQ